VAALWPPWKDRRMNRLGHWLWWMDRDDPRFRDSAWAKFAYAVVWSIGFLLLLLVSQLALGLLGRLGFVGRTGP
jgi:hypothetical protein